MGGWSKEILSILLEFRTVKDFKKWSKNGPKVVHFWSVFMFAGFCLSRFLGVLSGVGTQKWSKSGPFLVRFHVCGILFVCNVLLFAILFGQLLVFQIVIYIKQGKIAVYHTINGDFKF